MNVFMCMLTPINGDSKRFNQLIFWVTLSRLEKLYILISFNPHSNLAWYVVISILWIKVKCVGQYLKPVSD